MALQGCRKFYHDEGVLNFLRGVGNYGYQSEGIASYCFPAQYMDSVPLYHYLCWSCSKPAWVKRSD